MPFDAKRALSDVQAILAPALDILNGRVDDVVAPRWCDARGWTGFLSAMGDDMLERCETQGLAAHLSTLDGAPRDLVELARAVVRACRLPAVEVTPHALAAEALRSVSERKRRQLGTLLAVVAPMAERATRIVDVGAGSGHFTRLAAELFERETIGIERDPGRLVAATERAEDHARAAGGAPARYVALDACLEPLLLEAADLAVGLHACGEVGDRLVTTAAAAGCDVALVSCCLQKISVPARAPLSRAGLRLRRDALGLTNLTPQPVGVETTLAVTMAARETRYALAQLLRARGVDLAPGEEMRGINRRRARLGLGDVATRALSARGLAAPTEVELAHHRAEARRLYAVVRRLSLPRAMLARLVEIAVALDRAATLQESDHDVVVATLFERAVTPRNIALFASRRRGGLPACSEIAISA